MTSQINPNNINGAYPVAGQDNNSQGFRDNFTNTRTNFAFASAEITDLQNKALLKAPLTGTAVADNNLNGTLLVNAQLRDMSISVVDLSNISGSVIINYETGQYYTGTTTGSVTISFTNFPTSNIGGTNPAGDLILRLTVASTAHTLTLPSAVGLGYALSSIQGIQGISGQTITFAEAGTYEFLFQSTNGGSNILLSELTRPRNRWTNPLFLDISDSLAANGNLSLSTTTSVITSNANPLTGNLAVGTSGQIKIIAYGNASVGNAIVTVANAAWGGANTASFTNPGDACTLQYISGKWFVIGNNGATLA